MSNEEKKMPQEQDADLLKQAWMENFQAQTKSRTVFTEDVMSCLDICLECKCPVSFADVAGWGGGAAGGAIG